MTTDQISVNAVFNDKGELVAIIYRQENNQCRNPHVFLTERASAGEIAELIENKKD